MLIEKLKRIQNDLVVPVELIGEKSPEEPRIRLSGLGKDLFWQYMDIKNAENGYVEEIEPKLKRIFDLGHILEQYLFAQLDGIIHDKDKKVYTGIQDHRGEEIKGELDCKYTDDLGTTYIVDVKTMSNSSFTKLVEAQDIKKSHYIYYVQLQMYMHFEGHEDSFILAYNKDNSSLAEVFCPYDRDFCMEQIGRMQKLANMLKNNEAPALEYPNVRYVKTQKVRNKEEYKGLGQIIEEPHALNLFCPYIDTERRVIDAPHTKDVIYSERKPKI
jgi:hypothetical protein